MSAVETLALQLKPLGELRRDERLSRHTTFGCGGPADLFLTVRDADSLGTASVAAHDLGIGTFVLGSGSNILVADAGVRGLVIDNRARTERQIEGDHTSYVVESGTSFAAFGRRMCRSGLAGLEWAVGIPGSFGGAVVFNAGAYGGCLADVLTRARIQGPESKPEWLEAADLGLVYRNSVFSRHDFSARAVLDVEVKMRPDDSKALLAKAATYDGKRLTAQPRGRNAGSMFKNPPGKQAWELIDAVGLRGAARGEAAISDKHCNFFVNYGAADAADVAWLVAEAQRRVADQFGVELEREVQFVGDWS